MQAATVPGDTRTSLSYSALKPFLLATGNRFVDAAHRVTPPAANFGENVSYVRVDADDSGWRRLDLPHDWAIEGPFDITAPGNTGKLPYASWRISSTGGRNSRPPVSRSIPPTATTNCS